MKIIVSGACGPFEMEVGCADELSVMENVKWVRGLMADTDSRLIVRIYEDKNNDVEVCVRADATIEDVEGLVNKFSEELGRFYMLEETRR